MAWSGFPATQTTDWSALTFVEQFVKALSERRQSIGQSALTDPTVGWDVQSAAATPGASELSWRYLQDLLEGLVTFFVNSHDSGGNIRATDYYDGRATIDMWTQAAWRTAAGINASGFTRKYPDGVGGTTTAYGLMQAGDYIGPWIFNELKAGLDLLVWTKPSASWDMLDTSDNWAGDGGEWQPTWAGTKTYAENEFDGLQGYNDSLAPYAQTAGDYRAADGFTKAMMVRAKNYLYNFGLYAGCTRALDYYCKATKYRESFDAYSDDVLEDLWSQWASHTPTPATRNQHSPSALGTISTKPSPWCGEPVSGDPTKGIGWSTTDQAVIARWNVASGFVYV